MGKITALIIISSAIIICIAVVYRSKAYSKKDLEEFNKMIKHNKENNNND